MVSLTSQESTNMMKTKFYSTHWTISRLSILYSMKMNPFTKSLSSMEKWQGSLPARIMSCHKENWTVNGLGNIKFEKVKTANIWVMSLLKMGTIWKAVSNIVTSSLRSPFKVEMKTRFFMDILWKSN